MMSPMLSPGSDDIDFIDSQQLEIYSWLMVCMAILVALLSVVILYYILKSSWKKNPKRDSHPDLLDSK
ncbi:MAG: hypothetical protein A3D31_02470 [Candidatus Fluviicola riflensis]|nr:MAG: hypothetical protein CHH17_12570 [Candidatus Fluviicola riflensis]OGS78856.1 MAG: hypothetical protein A3D31_02470 [Candidatus Fluviicola riflensis]OGS85878.1 MAG: hypothetical protein A3E30_09955 [Fluviicola sp. RIFCSPHIGHO2_12_FULL_43_24]OGS86287.1 MAG: hypothetical protein A2724_01925 [Fluviicola sp. RIFCSPHIGHO2_01_FULL_43_53]